MLEVFYLDFVVPESVNIKFSSWNVHRYMPLDMHEVIKVKIYLASYSEIWLCQSRQRARYSVEKQDKLRKV